MKKSAFFFTLILCLLGSKSFSQPFPNWIGGLCLRLEVTDNLGNFIPATAASGNAAMWYDISGIGNDLQSGIGTHIPVLLQNVTAPGINAVHFDGFDDFMTESMSLLNGNGFDQDQATLFVVRSAVTNDNIINDPQVPNTNIARTMLSIASNHTFDDEYALISDWALYTTAAGQWVRRDHQCFHALPSNRPVILTAVFHPTMQNGPYIPPDYFVNDVLSTNNFAVQPPTAAPAAAGVVQREVLVGVRRNNASIFQEFFEGDIFEIVAYNRQLTPNEIHQVNEYLKCKYQVDYTACNLPATCDLDCVRSTPLWVTYNGKDANGNCMFNATVTFTPHPGNAVIGYDWFLPGSAIPVSTPVGPPSTTTQTLTVNFILPDGTTNAPVRIRIYTTNQNYTPGADFCCTDELSQDVWCTGGTGGVH